MFGEAYVAMHACKSGSLDTASLALGTGYFNFPSVLWSSLSKSTLQGIMSTVILYKTL